jgi:nucleotide-binding universal stress UspA family protein
MAPSLLILTDFFQAANRALDYATNLAAPLGARLVLLHVRRDSLLDPEMFTGVLSHLSKEATDLALSRVASELAVPVVVEIGHGRVAFAVADAVSRHHPLLVVLGRPDYSETPDELVHTTSLDILRTSPYPLLVVPAAVATTAPPRRVLLALDNEAFMLGDYAGMARNLLNALGAELTVLHVAAHPGPEDRAAEVLESVRWTGLAIDLPAPVHYRRSTAAEPAEGILAVAQPEEYDLVVVLARPRSFWGELFHRSVTAQVLKYSTIPVLVLPTEA